MKRIAVFTASLNIGGIERVLLTYATGLSKKEHDVSYVTCAGNGDFQIDKSLNVKHINLGTLRLRKSIFALASFLKKHKPDIILTANDATLIVYLAKLLSRSSAKLITSQHNYYDNVEANSFRHRFIIKHIYPRCEKIIAVSKGIHDMLLNTFKIKSNKLVTLYNPLDVNYILSSAELPVEIYENYVLFVGRLSEVKNLPLLFKAFDIFRKTHPCVQLLIIGDGDQKDSLESLINEMGLIESVKFLGVKPNPYPYIKHARVIVLPSSSEALPTILLESMLLGKTIVSTPTSGGIDILNEGAWGYLSGSLNKSEDFAEALEVAYNNPKDGDILKEAIIANYDLDSKVEELEKLWN